MPRNITLIKVFIASPSDVEEERTLAYKIINDLNIQIGDLHNIRLELLGWETHTYPNIGLYAQDVINKQIGDYDIFLGIMWNKFGSTTPNADSGTEEEFQIAFQKYLNNPDSIDVLFFFKDTAKTLSSIDIGQLAKVDGFKKKLEAKNLLYKKFTQVSEFETILRLALTQILHKYSSPSSNPNVNIIVKNYQSTSEIIINENKFDNEHNEDVGFFEAIDLATKSLNKSLNSTTKMTKYVVEMGKSMDSKTERLKVVNQLQHTTQINEIKKIVNQVSDILTKFNKNIEAEIPTNSEAFSDVIKYYNIIITTYSQFGIDNIDIVKNIQGMKDALPSTMESIKGMTNAINSFPSLTTKFLKVKNETVKILVDLVEELQIQFNLTEQLELNARNLFSN